MKIILFLKQDSFSYFLNIPVFKELLEIHLDTNCIIFIAKHNKKVQSELFKALYIKIHTHTHTY